MRISLLLFFGRSNRPAPRRMKRLSRFIIGRSDLVTTNELLVFSLGRTVSSFIACAGASLRVEKIEEVTPQWFRSENV